MINQLAAVGDHPRTPHLVSYKILGFSWGLTNLVSEGRQPYFSPAGNRQSLGEKRNRWRAVLPYHLEIKQ